jgi:type IX secretion system PorP/SprF family membrane protein
MYNALYFNPAYAGSRNTVSATLLAREQWVGMSGAPSTQYFSFHTPLKDQRIGLGFHLNNDKFGSRKKTSGYVDLSGSIRLNSKNDRLNIGLSAGLDDYAFGFNDLYAVDPNDPIATMSFNKTVLNVGAGIYYFGKKHYVGLSVPMILDKTEEFNGQLSNIATRHYFLTAGYVFRLNAVLDLKPSTIVKYVPGAPLTFDLNVSLLAYKKLWVGAMYRYDEGVGVNVAYVINKTFTVGYAYDYPINGLRTYQYGSHELMLQFDWSKYKSQEKTFSPRYF